MLEEIQLINWNRNQNTIFSPVHLTYPIPRFLNSFQSNTNFFLLSKSQVSAFLIIYFIFLLGLTEVRCNSIWNPCPKQHLVPLDPSLAPPCCTHLILARPNTKLKFKLNSSENTGWVFESSSISCLTYVNSSIYRLLFFFYSAIDYIFNSLLWPQALIFLPLFL